MANTIAQLAVKLGLETADFVKSLEISQRNLEQFSDKLRTAGAIGSAAFVAMTYKALEFSDRISDVADANEIAVAKVLALSEALNLAGGNGENAGKLLASFTAKVDAAAQGGKDAQESFKRIGISLADIGKMTNEQLLDKTINNLAKIPDVVARNAIAFDLLGKGIRGVSLKTIQEEMSKGTQAFQEYAYAVRLAGELHDKLEAKTTKTLLMFTKEVLPTLNAMFDAFNSKGGAAEAVFATLKYTLIGLWTVAGEVSEAFMSISATVNAIGKGDFGMKSGEYLNTINQLRLDKLSRDRKIAELLNPPKKEDVKDDFAGRMTKAAKDAEADKLRQMELVASRISDEYDRQVKFSLQQLKVRNEMLGMTSDEKRVQEAVNQQLDMTSKKIDDIKKQKLDAAGRGMVDTSIFDKQIAEVERLGKAAAKSAKEIEMVSIASQRTFAYGWNKAFAQYAEDAQNYGKLAEDMFSSFTNNMNSALDKFVETGKVSFGDLASSIIKDLIKIELRMQMMQLFSMARGGLGSFFGGGAGGFVNEAGGMEVAGSLGFADGGNPPVGVPSLVGERGPELFVPRQAGTIIPNNKLGDALGGGSGVTYNGPVIQNMSAIDTQSGIQFLAKNKMTIWSMNQSANRSIPSGR